MSKKNVKSARHRMYAKFPLEQNELNPADLKLFLDTMQTAENAIVSAHGADTPKHATWKTEHSYDKLIEKLWTCNRTSSYSSRLK